MRRQSRQAKRVVIAAAFLAVISSAPARADELATVRTLYASAAYEEALALLDSVRSPDAPELIDQYKALCFLALGRPADAERTLETLVKRQPRFDFEEAEVSPRLIELFQTVRKRTLPAAVRAMYSKGKASFDAKRFEEATAQFKELISLSADSGLSESDAAGLRDVIELGEGFLGLAEVELVKIAAARRAEAEKSAAAEAAVAPASPAVTTPSAAASAAAFSALDPLAPTAVAAGPDSAPFALHPPITYTSADEGIVPPVEVSRVMPRWVPGNPLLRSAKFRGVLEYVVDENGGVESATLVVPISPLYDSSLLEAASTWRFRPATKDGRPVRFRKRIEVVLQPSKE
jgi:tetratricopeptide (TPR) repeat protein